MGEIKPTTARQSPSPQAAQSKQPAVDHRPSQAAVDQQRRSAGGAAKTGLKYAILQKLAPPWMGTAIQGSKVGIGGKIEISVSFIRVVLEISGTLSRDDDRQFRLSGTLTAGGGVGIGPASLVYTYTRSKTWAFKTYPAYQRWLTLVEATVRQDLLRWGLSKKLSLKPEEHAELKRKVETDRNVSASGGAHGLKLGAAKEKSNSKAALSIKGTYKNTTYTTRDAKGMLKETTGKEKRVDLSGEISNSWGGLQIDAFYQNMQGHANPDMDGEYVNVTVKLSANIGKLLGKVPLPKSSYARMNAAVKKDISIPIKGYKAIPNLIGASIHNNIKSVSKGKASVLGGLGFEVEFVRENNTYNLRFIRTFIHAKSMGVETRRVLHETVGSASLSYMTQLYNGYARAGEKGLDQWEAWSQSHKETMRGVMIASGTPGTSAYKLFKHFGLPNLWPDKVKGIKKAKSVSSDDIANFNSDLGSIFEETQKRDAKSPRWKLVGRLKGHLSTLGPAPQFSSITTGMKKVPEFGTVGELLRKGGRVEYSFAGRSQTVMDIGDEDYARMAKEFGLFIPSTIEARDFGIAFGKTVGAVHRESYNAWHASARRQQEALTKKNAAVFMRHYIAAVRQAKTPKVTHR